MKPVKTDLELRQDVIDELEWEPSLDAANIGVYAHRGIVTLTGYVASYPEKLMAEAVVKRVKHVRALVEDLQVQLPAEKILTDQVIAEAVYNILRWHVWLPVDHISIKVEAGHVTLDGDVDWQYQIAAACNAVKTIKGVKGISNFLYITTHKKDEIDKDGIDRALKRSAQLDASKVDIGIEGKRVTLNGRVKSHSEKEAVEEIVWSSKGVSNVRNNLEVVP